MYRTIYLILNKRRYQCKCGKRFYESYDFLPRYHRMTRRTIKSIVKELQKVTSLKSVAEQFNVSTPTVTRILNTIRHPNPNFQRFCVLMNLNAMLKQVNSSYFGRWETASSY